MGQAAQIGSLMPDRHRFPPQKSRFSTPSWVVSRREGHQPASELGFRGIFDGADSRARENPSGNPAHAASVADFRGRPPFRPLACALLRFASDVTLPPRLAKMAATARGGSIAGRIAVIKP